MFSTPELNARQQKDLMSVTFHLNFVKSWNILKELLLVVVKLLASEKRRMSHHSRVKKISTSAGVNLTQFMRE